MRISDWSSDVCSSDLWELFGANPAFDVFWRALRDDLQARRPVSDLRLVYNSPEGGRFRWRINGKPYYDRTGRFCGYSGVAAAESAEVVASRCAEAAEELLSGATDSISAYGRATGWVRGGSEV